MSSEPERGQWAYNGRMSDVIFLGVAAVFFVLMALYVRLCDRMIGPDEVATDVDPTSRTSR